MVTIHNFDEGLRYVNRLGFTVKPGFPGWIIQAQKRMCDAEQALWLAAGKEYPFKVHYHRKGRFFEVVRQDGVHDIVDAREL